MCSVVTTLWDPHGKRNGIPLSVILEWIAISSSRGPFRSMDRSCLLSLLNWQVGSISLAPPWGFEGIILISQVLRRWLSG